MLDIWGFDERTYARVVEECARQSGALVFLGVGERRAARAVRHLLERRGSFRVRVGRPRRVLEERERVGRHAFRVHHLREYTGGKLCGWTIGVELHRHCSARRLAQTLM